jgi:hypothetical protein
MYAPDHPLLCDVEHIQFFAIRAATNYIRQIRRSSVGARCARTDYPRADDRQPKAEGY